MLDAILGFLAGASGLIPFLHLNLLLSLFDFSSVAFVAALGFSSTVFAFIPAVFFGLPGESTGVSALPSHELAAQGQGMKALRLLCLSFFFGLAGSVILLPAFTVILPTLSTALKPFVGIALLCVVAVFFTVHGLTRFSLMVFLLSGVLGTITFNYPVVREPLFPLLTGLFGLPTLFFSIGAKKPELRDAEAFTQVDHTFVALGVVLGGLSVLLPALSPAFIAAFAFLFLEQKSESFLVLTGSLAASKTFFDVVSATVLHKARSGFAAFFLEANAPLAETLAAGVFAASASILLVLFLGKKLAVFFTDNAKKAFCCIVVAGVFLTSGAMGVAVLAVATLVGLLPFFYDTPRGTCVGALVVPAVLHAFAVV